MDPDDLDPTPGFEQPASPGERAGAALRRASSDYRVAIRVLRWVAGVALAFWLIDVSLSAWSIWELSADAGSIGGYIQLGSLPPEPESISTIDRLRVVALGSVSRGGFYLLTFAVCYGLVLHFTPLLDNDES